MASRKVYVADSRYYHTGTRAGSFHNTLQFPVPSKSVRLIIGIKGKQLRKIEEETGLKRYSICISNESVRDVQMVTVKGIRRNCEAAKQQIEAIVDSSMKRKPHSQSEHLFPLKHSLVDRVLEPKQAQLARKQPFPAWQPEVSNPETVLKVEVPSSSLKLIIGRGGRQLREIKEESQLQKSAIEISRYESKPGMQIVTIKGTRWNCEAAKGKIEELVKLSVMGYSAVAGRMNKHLSFITFLNDTDQIVFQQYKGIPPINWKDDDLYFLEACQREASMPPLEEMHRRLRNYSLLKDTLYAVMETSLRRAPVYLKLEARFGKVVWRSDGWRSVSDEVLEGRHRIQDLERGGKVSVEEVLGGKNTRWCFQTTLSDTTVVESVKTLGLPLIGDARQLDIIMLHHSTDQQYLIRIKQNREKTFFEVLEVLVRPDKPYVFDCLNLERDLDVRIAVSYSPHHTDTQGVAEMKGIAEEMCRGMSLRDGCLYVKKPPEECTIEYARWADHTMYLVSHKDKVHGECQYILAHYQVEDCTQPEQSSLSSAVEDKEVRLQFRDKHHEVELWNCQWMVDFAALYGKTPEEMFTCICCDPTKIKVWPKDKDKVDAASVTSELDPFIACALQLALINRD